MRLLAIDTSTEACSAALFVDGETAGRFRLAPREHAHLILPMCEELLAEAGLALAALDALGFGRGPGAFTGVRVATATIQGMALGADLPVVGVSSLAALAQGVVREKAQQAVAAAMDARMGEVYWGAYRVGDGTLMLAGEEQVCAPEAVPLPEQGTWCGAGAGWGAYEAALRARLGGSVGAVYPDRYPDARDVATLAAAGYERGQAVPAEQALPVYLRDRVVGRP